MENNVNNVLRLIKVDMRNPQNKDIDKSIKEAFDNASTYFRRTIKGNKVYVGKRFNPYIENQLKQKIAFISPISKSGILMRNVLKKSDREKNFSRSKLSNLPSIKSSHSSITNLNHSSPDIKYQVSDAELNQLFENIKQKTEKNSSHINDFVDQLEEPHLKNIFYLQEDSLKRQEAYKKQVLNIENRLLKATNKFPEDLLINQVKLFRVIKELKAESEEMHSDNQSNLFKWAMNLRSERRFVGMRKAMINIGSEMRPNWAIIYEKMPKIKEKIRLNNNNSNGNNNDKESSSSALTHRSISMSKYIGGSSNSNRRRMMEMPMDDNKEMKNSFDDLQGLNIEGKSLLQSEMEQIKAIAGKKKMIRQYNNNDDNINNEDKTSKVIASNLSLKNIFDVKTINSCMKIHQG